MLWDSVGNYGSQRFVACVSFHVEKFSFKLEVYDAVYFGGCLVTFSSKALQDPGYID